MNAVSSADRDLLNMDRAAIWAEIAQRNALRKSAQLPLLDEQREFDNACQTILSARWRAFRATKQADYERIYDEVVAERGHPSGSIGGWGIRMEIGKRFEAFLRAHYSDEITIVMQIAPDYLAITRQVTEGRKIADWHEFRLIVVSRITGFSGDYHYVVVAVRGLCRPRRSCWAETIPQRLGTGRRAFVLPHPVLTSIAALMFSLSVPGQQAYRVNAVRGTRPAVIATPFTCLSWLSKKMCALVASKHRSLFVSPHKDTLRPPDCARWASHRQTRIDELIGTNDGDCL